MSPRQRLFIGAQTQGSGAFGGVGDGGDTLRLGDQRPTLGRAGTAELHAGRFTLGAGQHLNQQRGALVARLRSGRTVDAVDFPQGLGAITVEGVGKRQVAARIEVRGRQSAGCGEGPLHGVDIAQLRLGCAKPREGLDVVRHEFGSTGEQRLGALWIPEAQLRSAQTQQADGVVRLQSNGFLVGLFGARQIAAGQASLAKPLPGLETGAGLFRRALVQGGGGATVTAGFDIARQFHQTLVGVIARCCRGITGRVAAAGAKQGETGEQQNVAGENRRQRRCSWVDPARAGHSIEPSSAASVKRLRNLVIVAGRQLFHRPACADSGFVRRGLALSLLLLAGSAGLARAEATPQWFEQPYAYVVINQDLRSALEAFGRNLGLPMAISSRVKGRAQSNLKASSAGEFLDALCSNGGLTWFFDGNMLHVNSEEEIEIRQFEPGGFQLDELQASLDELGVAGKHLSLRSSFHGDGMLISGPPPYMALVQQRIDQLQGPVMAEPEVVRERGVRVFRGSAGIQMVKSVDE